MQGFGIVGAESWIAWPKSAAQGSGNDAAEIGNGGEGTENGGQNGVVGCGTGGENAAKVTGRSAEETGGGTGGETDVGSVIGVGGCVASVGDCGPGGLG